jgi:hypothetical protein
VKRARHEKACGLCGAFLPLPASGAVTVECRRCCTVWEVGRRGDDLIGYDDVMVITGLARSTLTHYHSTGMMPESEVGVRPRDRPRWRRDVIEAWQQTRSRRTGD